MADIESGSLTTGIVYYTHNKRPPAMAAMIQDQIKLGLDERRIVSVSSEPIGFGTNIVYRSPLQRDWLDIFEKILVGVETSSADIVFLCEDDVLYHPSHFSFEPPRDDLFYYNVNVWKLRLKDGFCLRVDCCKQVSGLVADRKLLVEHYRERVAKVKECGFRRRNGFEPGTRRLATGGYDNRRAATYCSALPLVDIRHDGNATANRWRRKDFRNEKYTSGWLESDSRSIPGWSKLPSLDDLTATSA